MIDEVRRRTVQTARLANGRSSAISRPSSHKPSTAVRAPRDAQMSGYEPYGGFALGSEPGRSGSIKISTSMSSAPVTRLM